MNRLPTRPPPPPVGTFLEPWREQAIKAARRGPSSAHSLAATMEVVFASSPAGLDAEAKCLVDWLRAVD
jgi:hypothetical protein